MAGSRMKYRHLGRTSAHRQALLRNLVTSLFTHESIQTTWPKAKEAQRLAEKLITLGKKNTEASKRRALSIFYVSRDISQGGETEILGEAPTNSLPDTTRTPSKALRHPPRALRRASRRLHARPAHRANEARPSPIRDPRTRRRTKRHAFRHHRQDISEN